MKETGTKLEGNIKTLTLDQVFALNLQDHESKVQEIVQEADQEHKNEEEIQKIEQKWKTKCFELHRYTKGNVERGIVLKGTADVKAELEDQQQNLQAVASSKYAGAF